MVVKASEFVPRTVDVTRITREALETVRQRVPLAVPASRQQILVAAVLSEGYNVVETGVVLGITERTVYYHLRRLAARIPSDLTPKVRVIVWYRGGDLMVLTGKAVFSSTLLPEATGARNSANVVSSPPDSRSARSPTHARP